MPDTSDLAIASGNNAVHFFKGSCTPASLRDHKFDPVLFDIESLHAGAKSNWQPILKAAHYLYTKSVVAMSDVKKDSSIEADQRPHMEGWGHNTSPK
jgi:hypothetical protein